MESVSVGVVSSGVIPRWLVTLHATSKSRIILITVDDDPVRPDAFASPGIPKVRLF